ncbi:MAG: DUF4276 family protein [Nitrosomonadales bacterium]|nr:DUF4276 family protein [Nitrosomonadales bacterium]
MNPRVIAEDASDVSVVSHILAKYLGSGGVSVKKFVGNGCGKLRQKCDSWTENLIKRGCEHILIFHDLDRNKESELRRKLVAKVPPEKYPNTIIVIPIQEMEAWLLSDATAIKSVFNLSKAPNKITDCESIESPKEHLRDLVWKMGKKRYLNTTHNEKLAEKITLSNLIRCSSFKRLDEYIKDNIAKG